MDFEACIYFLSRMVWISKLYIIIFFKVLILGSDITGYCDIMFNIYKINFPVHTLV